MRCRWLMPTARRDPAPVIVPASAIEPAGFAPEEALLPWPARSFAGFRLLTEYFAFPEKFLFVDFTRTRRPRRCFPTATAWRSSSISTAPCRNWSAAIGADALALGCTPIVNLFPQRCEPIQLTHTDIEYRIVPDARRPAAMEVWQVERVRETAADGSSRPWRPFYRLTHGDRGQRRRRAASTSSSRRPTAAAPLTGSEVYIAPHDPGFDPDAATGAVLSVDALCFNRDLPVGLPFGGGRPAMRLAEAAAERGPAFLPDGAEHAAAPAAARAPVLASGVASVAGAPVDRRRRRGSGGVARGAASLRHARLGRNARRDRRAGRSRRDAGQRPGARIASRRLSAGAWTSRSNSTPRPGRAPGSISSPRCSTAFWRCTRRSTRSSEPPPWCAVSRDMPPPGRRAPACGFCCDDLSSVPAPAPSEPDSPYARLLAEPRRFRFDAAVRILAREAETADPADAARFRSAPGLAYPAEEVEGGGAAAQRRLP